jgi:hypothetical protein
MNSNSSDGDEWTVPVGINKEGNMNESLLSAEDSEVITRISSNIVQASWQDDLSIRLKDNGENLYCCLGVSPSQFRRLMPPKGNADHGSSHLATLYAQIAMQHTLEQMNQSKNSDAPMLLVVVIVDAIQKYNFAVFKNKPLQTGIALRYALEEGERLFSVFKQARSRLSSELAQHVRIIRWNDICCNEKYDECVRVLQQHVTVNEQFAELVDEVVQVFINVRRSGGYFTKEQRLILREYVLNELPSLTHGFVYDGHHCPITMHPVLSSSNVKNDDQQNVMRRLLHYVHHSCELRSNLNLIKDGSMCQIYDIVIPIFKPPLSLPAVTGDEQIS